MPITIDWGTKVIHVPKADLTPLGGVLYGLDLDWFRLALKNLEDSDEGMVMPDTHRHNTEVELSGVTYARFVEIINGYTVEFEDGQYVVVCSGANHNLADVKVPNQVSLIIGNSAGLIKVETGVSGLTPEESAELHDIYSAVLGRWKLDHNNKTLTLYHKDNSVLQVFSLIDTTAHVPVFIERLPQ